MTPGYKLYCESCGEDSYVELNKTPEFCPSCGAEIDDTNLVEEKFEDVDKEWEELTDHDQESIDNINEWNNFDLCGN